MASCGQRRDPFGLLLSEKLVMDVANRGAGFGCRSEVTRQPILEA